MKIILFYTSVTIFTISWILMGFAPHYRTDIPEYHTIQPIKRTNTTNQILHYHPFDRDATQILERRGFRDWFGRQDVRLRTYPCVLEGNLKGDLIPQTARGTGLLPVVDANGNSINLGFNSDGFYVRFATVFGQSAFNYYDIADIEDMQELIDELFILLAVDFNIELRGDEERP